MKRKYKYFAAILSLVILFTDKYSQKIDRTFWIANGDVYVLMQNFDSLIVGGTFTILSRPKARISELKYPSGSANKYFPSVYNNQVNSITYSSNGDLYLGGNFTQMTDTSGQIFNIQYIAKISNNGNIDTTFLPGGTNNTVRKVLIHNNFLYFAGDFTSAGGQPRNNIARYDLITNTLDPWFLNVSGAVYDMMFDGDTLYIVGTFGSVQGVPRNRAAKILLPNTVLPWNPNANNTVLTIRKHNNIIFLGGVFTQLGPTLVNRIAGVDQISGTVNWSIPNGANNTVNKVFLYSTADSVYLFVGGAFTSIAGVARNYIATYNLTSNALTNWNPNPNNQVFEITRGPTGNTILIGGAFSNFASTSRRYICEINPPDLNYTVTSFAPEPSANINTIAVYDAEKLAIGGSFTSINLKNRVRLAAINLNTDEVTNWAPNINGSVWSLAIYGNELFIGGAFTLVDGVTRNRFASFNISNGALNNRIYSISSTVYGLVPYGDILYIGGAFTTITIGSLNYTRNRLGAINLITNEPTLFNPNLNNEVRSMVVQGNYLYIAGRFTTISGIIRNRIAKLDLSTNDLLPWNPNVGGTQFNGSTAAIYVYSIALGGSRVYFCGDFTQVSGASRMGIAAVDDETGNLIADWSPTLNNIGYDIKYFNNVVYVGGMFTQVNGSSVNRIAAIDGISGNLISTFNPNANNTIRYILVSPVYQKIFIGGAFTSLSNYNLITRLSSLTVPTIVQQYLTVGFTVPEITVPKNSTNNLFYVGLKWLDNTPPEQGVYQVSFNIQSASISIDTSNIKLPSYLQSNFNLTKTPITNGASIIIQGKTPSDLFIDNGIYEAQYNILEVKYNAPDSLGSFVVNLTNSSLAQIRTVLAPFVQSSQNVTDGITSLIINTYSIFPIFTPFFEAYPFAYRKYGDINWDGQINIADLTSIADAIIENYPAVIVSDPLYGPRKFFEFPVGETPINYDNNQVQDRGDRRSADLFGVDGDNEIANGEGDDVIDQMDLATLLDGLLVGVWPNYAIDAIRNKPAFLKTKDNFNSKIKKSFDLSSSIIFNVKKESEQTFRISCVLNAAETIKGLQFSIKNLLKNSEYYKVINNFYDKDVNFYHRKVNDDLNIILFGSKNIIQENGEYVLFELLVESSDFNDNILYNSEIIASVDNFSVNFINVAVASELQFIKEYKLYQNYPNPFNSETNLLFEVPEEAQVIVEVYDILGKKISEIFRSSVNKSRLQLKINFDNIEGKKLNSGVYLISVRAKSIVGEKNFSKTIKAVFLK